MDRIIEHNRCCSKKDVIREYGEWHSVNGRSFSTMDDDLNIIEYRSEGDVISGNMRDDVDENDD